METTNFIPAQHFSPGYYIREELEAREWTQEDFAEIIGRPLVAVNQIITGKRAVTPDTAKALAEAFGTSAQVWLNLESAYRLQEATHADPSISRRAKLYDYAPIAEIARRGWISTTESLDTLESEVLKLFGATSLDTRPTWEVAARKSDDYQKYSTSELAWFARLRQLGRAVSAKPFNRGTFEKNLPKLRSLCGDAENIRHLPKALAEFGVRFVVVEKLRNTRIDGGTTWLSDESPVIGVSLQFDRLDSFWHTVFHELMHVKNGDKFVIDVDMIADAKGTNKGPKPLHEVKVDVEAANYLVPENELTAFIARVSPFFSKTEIRNFANKIKINPGIVVGQLHHGEHVHWKYNREMLLQGQIRDIVSTAAITDGWDSRLGTLGV